MYSTSRKSMLQLKYVVNISENVALQANFKSKIQDKTFSWSGYVFKISYHGDLARLKESHFHDTNTLIDEVTERGDRLKVQALYP